MTDRRQASGRRADVLRALRRADGPIGVAAISEQLGVHPNTVRFHLEALLENGQVERAPTTPAGPGRPPGLFRPVRGMDPAGPRNYRMLAEVLAADFAEGEAAGRRAVAVGRSWGRRQAAAYDGPAGADRVDRLVGLLDELGFAPERRQSSGDGEQIGLRHCPFLELAATRRDVVCPIHLGLMQGAVETWGAPMDVERLDPFVEPDLCLAHLSRPGTAAG